jgi:hypothetical protein
MFRSFWAIFKGSTVKGTLFTVAKDLSIISNTAITIKSVKQVDV